MGWGLTLSKILAVFLLFQVVILGGAVYAADPQENFRAAEDLFTAGKYRSSIAQLEGLLDNLALVEADQILRAHMLLGISYFTVGDKKKARSHFQDLLNFDPQAELDPVYSSPKIRNFFARIKRDKEQQEERLRQEARKPQTAKPGKKKTSGKKEAEPTDAGPSSLELELPPADEKAPFHLGYNFIPFGVGQFKNGKKGKGIFFLSLESAALATSLIAVSLYELEKDGAGGFKDPEQAQTYRTMFYASFFTFIGTAVIGVVDSLFEYRGWQKKSTQLADNNLSLGLSFESVGVNYEF